MAMWSVPAGKWCPDGHGKYPPNADYCILCGLKLDNQEPEQGSDPLLGVVLDGRYKLIRRVGQGSMGVVYMAVRVGSDTQIAVKLLNLERFSDGELPGLRKRFLREAKLAIRVSHEHSVTIHDFGHAGEGLLFIAMEYLAGPSLRELILKKGVMSPDRAMPLFVQITRAVAKAHAEGVIHRDLKPGNVIIVQRRDPDEDVREIAKVVDWGIAASVRNDDATRTPGVGTRLYMAPELLDGNVATKSSDVYALGLLLYQMLTGRLPFQDMGSSVPDADLAKQRRRELPEPLSKARPGCFFSIELQTLLDDMLAVHPAQRPPDACELKTRLKALPEVAGLPSKVLTTQASKPEEMLLPAAVPPAPAPASAPPGRSGQSQGRRLHPSPRKGRMSSLLWLVCLCILSALSMSIHYPQLQGPRVVFETSPSFLAVLTSQAAAETLHQPAIAEQPHGHGPEVPLAHRENENPPIQVLLRAHTPASMEIRCGKLGRGAMHYDQYEGLLSPGESCTAEWYGYQAINFSYQRLRAQAMTGRAMVSIRLHRPGQHRASFCTPGLHLRREIPPVRLAAGDSHG